jgi:hypothetical protein
MKGRMYEKIKNNISVGVYKSRELSSYADGGLLKLRLMQILFMKYKIYTELNYRCFVIYIHGILSFSECGMKHRMRDENKKKSPYRECYVLVVRNLADADIHDVIREYDDLFFLLLYLRRLYGANQICFENVCKIHFLLSNAQSFFF